jgi:hypothetical protein
MWVTVLRRRTDQIKTLGHLEYGNFRYIFVGLVAEDLGQKNNILKNLRRGCFTPNAGHGRLLSVSEFLGLSKNQRRSTGSSMSAFARPRAASPSQRENSNPHAKKVCVKDLDFIALCSLISVATPV